MLSFVSGLWWFRRPLRKDVGVCVRMVDDGVAPSWEELRSVLEVKVREGGVGRIPGWMQEEQDPDDPDGLYPPLTKDGTLRLFGKREEDVRVTLYRDPAYWCPYCERVQLQLEVKKLPYRIRTINMRCYGKKPSYYKRMVPSGLLPAVEVDGRLMTESVDIMAMLERTFPEVSLVSMEGFSEECQKLMKLEREIFGWWCSFVWRRSDSRAEAAWDDVMGRWNLALDAKGGPFLLGEHISIVDIMAAPFLERYIASCFYWKGYEIRGSRFPAIDRWMEALETRIPAFRSMKADFYSTVKDLPPQMGTPFFSNGVDEYRMFVDGENGSWDLPLSPLSPKSREPVTDLDPTDRGHASRHYLEASHRLTLNHAKITDFSLRGPGYRPKTVTAPYSDPEAEPNTSLRHPMDMILRSLTKAMLEQDQNPHIPDPTLNSLNTEQRQGIFLALCYLRDRIGVPRDMMFPAARILRAYTHHYAKQLKTP